MMNNIESEINKRTHFPTIQINCECGDITEVTLDKQGIKYQKCYGCGTYYEVDTKIKQRKTK